MLTMLAEDAVLIADDGQWCVLREPPDVNADALCNELLVQHADCSAELKLTRRCGEALALVLRGQADPLSLLFPDGSLADTESLYQNSPPSKTYNGLIAAIFADCRAGAPRDRPLRILEIGAGTGSTTSYIVKELEDLAPAGIEYTFTDVSPLFLKRAAEKFGNPSYMRFKLLDIGRDPAAQGFEPGRFDIVVGANVLHATPDLGITLANVGGLMRPGGLLVVLEGATAQRFGDLTVGLLEGWWAYCDTHRRDYALMQREPWLKLLGEMGFVDAVAVPSELSGPVLCQQAVYIAQAHGQEARVPSRFVVVPDQQGFAIAVAQLLRAGGDTVDIISAQNASSLAANLRTALAAPCHGVVFLRALDIAISDEMSADTVLAGQELCSARLWRWCRRSGRWPVTRRVSGSQLAARRQLTPANRPIRLRRHCGASVMSWHSSTRSSPALVWIWTSTLLWMHLQRRWSQSSEVRGLRTRSHCVAIGGLCEGLRITSRAHTARRLSPFLFQRVSLT